jgi:hypothetical protein
MFAKQNSQRIGLLAGSTSRNPNANYIASALVLEQSRNDESTDRLEGGFVTKEAGHVDQQIAEKRPHLLCVLTESLDVSVH